MQNPWRKQKMIQNYILMYALCKPQETIAVKIQSWHQQTSVWILDIRSDTLILDRLYNENDHQITIKQQQEDIKMLKARLGKRKLHHIKRFNEYMQLYYYIANICKQVPTVEFVIETIQYSNHQTTLAILDLERPAEAYATMIDEDNIDSLDELISLWHKLLHNMGIDAEQDDQMDVLDYSNTNDQYPWPGEQTVWTTDPGSQPQ